MLDFRLTLMTIKLNYEHFIAKLNYFYNRVAKKCGCLLLKFTKVLLLILVLNYINNLVLCKFSANCQEVTLYTNISICDTSNRLHKVFIDDTEMCKKTEPSNIRHCKGQMYNTISSILTIEAIRCYYFIESYETVNYFLGVKTKEMLEPIKSPLSAARCRLVATTLHDEQLGKLSQIDEYTYQTMNKLDIIYTWPTGHTGTVTNIVFQKVSINYNFITNQLSSPVSDITHCKVESTSCQLYRETYVWDYDSKIKCPEKYISKTELETFYIYYDNNNEILHFEVPNKGLSFNRVFECGERLRTCFKKKNR